MYVMEAGARQRRGGEDAYKYFGKKSGCKEEEPYIHNHSEDYVPLK